MLSRWMNPLLPSGPPTGVIGSEELFVSQEVGWVVFLSFLALACWGLWALNQLDVGRPDDDKTPTAYDKAA